MSAFHDNALIGASGQQGYTISRSVRLRSSASAYFNRTNSSSPTNSIKWTWSGWVKRGILGAQQNLVGATNSGSDDTYFNFNSSDKIVLGSYTGAGTDYGITTAAVFRDPSAWYHVVAVLDTANATSADRAILYVNGVRQTVTNSASGMWPQNATNNKINTASQVVNIGRRSLGDSYLDGYLTEINFIDGQALTPSSFGETDAVTGVWKPKKYAGTYGTNGFYLNFSDNSAATAAAIGKDYSGNGNNWTPNNISVTSGVTYDSMTDVPTLTSATAANYCVLNPLDKGQGTSVADGNLAGTTGGGAAYYGLMRGTIGVTSGKWYWEAQITANGGSAGQAPMIGITDITTTITSSAPINTSTGAFDSKTFGYYGATGNKKSSAGAVAYGATYTTGDIIGVALDMDAGTLTFYKNNTSQGTAFNSGIADNTMTPALLDAATGGTDAINFGQRPFTYTPPTGFKALNTFNLPDATIKAGNKFFDVAIQTGNTTGRTVSGLAFQPDLVIAKNRAGSTNRRWGVIDSVRGVNKTLSTALTDAEVTSQTDLLTAFNSDGFTIGADAGLYGWNGFAESYAHFTWKKGATQGFDIVTQTTTASGAQTFNHSLGVAPKLILLKARTNGSGPWWTYHASVPSGYLVLNTTAALTASGNFQSVSSTNFVMSSGFADSSPYVAYLFSEVAGFSRMGSFQGNGSSDGSFVYLGFRARYLLIKETGNANSWEVYDTARNSANVQTQRLFPNDSLAEATTNPSLDILSNGFKCRAGNTGINRSGGTYIFAAFAENPFKNALAR